MESIIEQMKKISLSEDPLPLLIDMKTNLSSISNRDVVTMFEVDYPVGLSHIQPLFDVLNSSSNEQIRTCVDVLNHILTKINPQISLEYLGKQYILGLNHPHEDVRLLVMKQILSCSTCPDATNLLLLQNTLVLTLLNSLGDSSSEVVKTCHNTLVNLCAFPNVTQHLFTSEGFTILQRVMAKSDSYRFYVYDVCVKISLLNDDSLRVMLSSGILNQLVSEISTGDILTQLNVLELLSELAMNSKGLRHLQADGIVTKLSYLLMSAKEDQMGAILLPGLLKFFGHLGAVHPDILVEEESSVLREVMKISCDFAGQTEVALQLIAFETLCHIGSSTEGKTALRKFSVEMEQSLKDFSSHAASFPSEMKVRVLEALSRLFYLPVHHQTEDLLHLLQTWFEHLSPKSSLAMVYSLARQPFPEVLSASLLLLQSIAILPWGVRSMAQEPGFLEWLLDRNSMKDRQSKENRFKIVEIIHTHYLASKSILDEDMQQRVETFFTQGMFYVEAEPLVAFNENE